MLVIGRVPLSRDPQLGSAMAVLGCRRCVDRGQGAWDQPKLLRRAAGRLNASGADATVTDTVPVQSDASGLANDCSRDAAAKAVQRRGRLHRFRSTSTSVQHSSDSHGV